MKLDLEQIRDPLSGELLHQIVRIEQYPMDRLDRVELSSEDEFLQGAVIQIPKGHVFRPHVHLERVRTFEKLRAQESWVVLRGSVEAHYYSESGEKLATRILGPGDASLTYRGGHGYSTLSESALVYEFKSGPYEGQVIDKRFLAATE